MPVCSSRLVEKTGRSSPPPDLRSSVSPGTWPGTLAGVAVDDPLELLEARRDAAHGGGEDQVGAASGGDQAGAREQIGDVVLAEVDEAEAEGQRVGPGDRALP